MIKALWPPAPCIHTFRDGAPCPNDGRYGDPSGGPRSCWRHLTDAERLAILEQPGERCLRTYGDGRPCSQRMRYKEPSPGATPSCRRHLTREEKRVMRAREVAVEKALAEMRPDPTWGLLNQDDYLSKGNVYLTWDIPTRSEGQNDLDYLQSFQAGRCAWCGNVERYLVQDHDHDMELLRGLLCVLCNGDEARFGRHVAAPGLDRPHAWDLYRRIPPTALLSLRVRYANKKNCQCGCQERSPSARAAFFEPLREVK